MFQYNELSDLHLEITSRCQASCPMCLRNFHGGGTNSLLELHDWTLEDFKRRVPKNLLNQLNGFYFCGNLGDPIINDNLIDMIEYAVAINRNLFIRIHTNGGARGKEWWKKLAEVLPSNHLVTFSLDGLEDTHSLYRLGTTFKNIMTNAETFIDNHGKAEWSFIKFKHNEHQVEEAKSIALKKGFISFVVKNTSRFIRDPKFNVIDKTGDVTHYLEPPTHMINPIVSQEILNNYKKIVADSVISCVIKKEKQLFIDCKGYLYPCCWIASLPWTEIKKDSPAYEIKIEMKKQYNNLIRHFRGDDFLSLDKHSIEEILLSNEWKSLGSFLWNDNKFIMCARTCSSTEQKFMKATDQKIEKLNFEIT